MASLFVFMPMERRLKPSFSSLFFMLAYYAPMRVIDLEIFMTTIIDDFEHFAENSIARGFKPHEFSNLETDVKIKLIKLMARISEKSYRRGLQHGSLGIAIVDPAELRFNVSPDYSPFTDVADENGNWVNDKQSAIDRLKMEYGVLRDIGLSV